MKSIKIDFEGRDEGCAFFALYAGLRMYTDLKAEQNQGTNKVSIAGSEAYSILYDLKVSHPKEWEEAKKEYDINFKNLSISGVAGQIEQLPRSSSYEPCEGCDLSCKHWMPFFCDKK